MLMHVTASATMEHRTQLAQRAAVGTGYIIPYLCEDVTLAPRLFCWGAGERGRRGVPAGVVAATVAVVTVVIAARTARSRKQMVFLNK